MEIYYIVEDENSFDTLMVVSEVELVLWDLIPIISTKSKDSAHERCAKINESRKRKREFAFMDAVELLESFEYGKGRYIVVDHSFKVYSTNEFNKSNVYVGMDRDTFAEYYDQTYIDDCTEHDEHYTYEYQKYVFAINKSEILMMNPIDIPLIQLLTRSYLTDKD
jgi:hypothetical protein